VAEVLQEMATGREKKHPWLSSFFKSLWKKPLGLTGLAITLLLLLTGIFADFLAPYGYNDTNVSLMLSPPSAQFWLGTDSVGRDVLSRVIYGARISMVVGLAASIVATTISLIIGIMSGYLGGAFDLTVQRVVDTWMCLPQIILMMVIIAIIGPGVWSIILVLGLSWGVIGSRIIRGAVVGIRENAYVTAASATGCSVFRMLIRHILPNIMAPAIVLFTTRVPNAILVEASLSFLGFGIPEPIPSWGGMLSGTGRSYMLQAPWMVFWPGLALAVVVYGINMFGDAVRDILDPRLRGGAGYGVAIKRVDSDRSGSNSRLGAGETAQAQGGNLSGSC
jgi:peptide/nickel transport system permease protein